jgi:hypothetical protein
MVDDKIHDDVNSALVRLARQHIEVRERSIHRVDVLIIGNIVAKIKLRRGIAEEIQMASTPSVCK